MPNGECYLVTLVKDRSTLTLFAEAARIAREVAPAVTFLFVESRFGEADLLAYDPLIPDLGNILFIPWHADLADVAGMIDVILVGERPDLDFRLRLSHFRPGTRVFALHDFHESLRSRGSDQAPDDDLRFLDRTTAVEGLEEFFGILPPARTMEDGPDRRFDFRSCSILVPYRDAIDPACERAVDRLERYGCHVDRHGGGSAIDAVRNQMLSRALDRGHENILFIDSDVGFDPSDAIKLLSSPQPIVTGVYAKKGRRELASIFEDGIRTVRFGVARSRLEPLKYAGMGFFAIKSHAVRRIIEANQVPYCGTPDGHGFWALFQPMVLQEGDRHTYLAEDWAFCERARAAGLPILADPSIRLWHFGRYGYGWEDAGRSIDRFEQYEAALHVP
ncbi:MAG: hypothetical protein U0800_19630 [Isosphaeraceae bacterium]